MAMMTCNVGATQLRQRITNTFGVALVSYIIYTRAKCNVELLYLPSIHVTVL